MLLAALLLPAAPLRAQAPSEEVHPRALVDSDYAVRQAVSELAEGIRHGVLPAEAAAPDAQLATAITALHSAAAGRPRARPRPELGAAWDFQLQVVQIEPAGPDRVRVTATAGMATDPTAAERLVLTLERQDFRWHLAAHEGLIPRLRTITQRIARKGGR